MWKLFVIFYSLQIQKRKVSARTIWGNLVLISIIYFLIFLIARWVHECLQSWKEQPISTFDAWNHFCSSGLSEIFVKEAQFSCTSVGFSTKLRQITWAMPRNLLQFGPSHAPTGYEFLYIKDGTLNAILWRLGFDFPISKNLRGRTITFTRRRT